MKYIVTGGCVLATAAVLMAEPGIAVADNPFKGMTYAATSKILAADTQAKIVISTITGSRLPLDDCLVANYKRAVVISGTGRYVGVSYLLDLNCNGALASAGTPGNSLESAVGKTEKDRQASVDALNANPDYCNTSDAIHANCVTLCNELEPGKCTFELS